MTCTWYVHEQRTCHHHVSVNCFLPCIRDVRRGMARRLVGTPCIGTCAHQISVMYGKKWHVVRHTKYYVLAMYPVVFECPMM